ncbi:MAG: hypothetical protein ACSLE1_06985 [Sphingobium sp.]
MADFEDFDDGDWHETLAELRLMVAGAGFSEWDAASAIALEEHVEGRAHPRWLLQRYAESFVSFLKVRSRWNLDRMRENLGGILHVADGRPVL